MAYKAMKNRRKGLDFNWPQSQHPGLDLDHAAIQRVLEVKRAIVFDVDRGRGVLHNFAQSEDCAAIDVQHAVVRKRAVGAEDETSMEPPLSALISP